MSESITVPNDISAVNVIKELKETDFKSLVHSTIPSLNIYIDNEESEHLKKKYVEEYDCSSYSCSVCMPYGDPAVFIEDNLNWLDPSTELVHDKKRWERQKEKIILANLKTTHYQPYRLKSGRIKKASTGTVKLAQHLDNDPDPNFSGFYNWYYTDGVVNTLSYLNDYSLISVRDSIPGIVVITPIEITGTDCVPSETKTKYLHTGNKQAVLQTAVSDSYIAVRQRNFSSLFKIYDVGKFKKIHSHNEMNDSIISISINDKLNGEYCTLTTSHKLNIWSPEMKNESKISVNLDKFCNKSCDHWGSVKYLTNNNIIISTRSCVYLKDLRTNVEKNIHEWNPKLNSMLCDNVSLITKSSCNEKNIYLGTTHHLFEIDLRQGFTKQWKHMMESPPLFGSSCSISNNEVVFIGSQNINEICCIETEKGNVAPFLLPSPDEMITNAKFKGFCLNPSISTRCNLSMIGLTSIPYNLNDTGVCVFRNTSVGDLFYQKLITNDEPAIDFNHIDLTVLSSWEEKCIKAIENLSSRPLKVTGSLSNDNLNKILIKPNKQILNNISRKCKVDKKVQIDKSWRFSKQKLLSLNDPLSQCLLDIWDIEDDEWCVNNKNKPKSSEGININSKINNWLAQSLNSELTVQSHNGDNSNEHLVPSITDSTTVSFPYENTSENMLGLHFLDDSVRSTNEVNDLTNTRQTDVHSNISDDHEDSMEENIDSDNLFTSNIKKKINSTVTSAECKSRFSSGF
ncbi:TATA box-binding protein-associated factor RNA polymerase I subunit C-like [Lycorma delicatula]|uniref:TATA box-binding protein-associated factor RNA polymerase I subunit C-like n=1 Tax=Lycorma delicatula TaxID=130591 RepID=UPI003F50FAFC